MLDKYLRNRTCIGLRDACFIHELHCSFMNLEVFVLMKGTDNNCFDMVAFK